MAYFPMFVDIQGKNCLIVGGGKVAYRKALVMQEFGAHIIVVAPAICSKIKELSDITMYERGYTRSDLAEAELVIAATDQEKQNHEIAQACKEMRIPVNAVDQIEDCSFIFPSYVSKKNVIAAFSSSGKSPVLTQYLKKKMQGILSDKLGELNEYLGEIRMEVKGSVDTEEKRKKVYQKMLSLGLEQEELPSPKQLSQVIKQVNEGND